MSYICTFILSLGRYAEFLAMFLLNMDVSRERTQKQGCLVSRWISVSFSDMMYVYIQ